jgi:hypothetical protein
VKLTQLIYVSHLVNQDESALAAILESAVRRNRQSGITGILLYAEGNLIQVLEGDPIAVQETYGRISIDQRHGDITCLQNEEVAARSFPEWSMGYKGLRPEEIEELHRYAPLFRFRPGDKFEGIAAGDALDMLLLFSKR